MDVLDCQIFVTQIGFPVVLVSHMLRLCLYSLMVDMIRDIIVLFCHISSS